MDTYGLAGGGRGGIRTHGTLAGTPVFKTGALNHSATLPLRATSITWPREYQGQVSGRTSCPRRGENPRVSSPPAQHLRVQPPRDLDQPCPCRWMQRLQWMAHGIGGDDAALLHQDLAGLQAALAVLIVDQRQPAGIGGHRLVAAAGEERVHDLADAVGIAAAGHG